MPVSYFPHIVVFSRVLHFSMAGITKLITITNKKGHYCLNALFVCNEHLCCTSGLAGTIKL
jgi:hypothetical protein